MFDKLGFMRPLEADGTFNRPQAERLTEASHQAVLETVATKADVARLEARIDAMDAHADAKLAGLSSGVEASVASMKMWTVGVGVALFSALAAIRFFGHQ